ncbi:MAG: gfo/Idh/MocA family oxidoreductase [Candidatus Omnitrophota bacterium]|jgi:predicted dehydrogenase|nr:MAG: gfo/Idh/MocA family oxidoreductase [Candidatus Omnitrophota bacterium]
MSRNISYSKRINRRSFLKTGALAPFATTVIPASAIGTKEKTSPSDRIAIAAIGNGSRCVHALLPAFIRETDTQIVAVCDCFEERRHNAKSVVDTRYENNDCVAYRFHEEVLERDDIDAVLLATGDRWHAVLSALAARAGKDVYTEKPFCLTIDEGRKLVEVTRKYGTVWQCGTQRHTNPDYLYTLDVVHQGKIGKLHTILTGLGEWGGNGVATPAPVPAGFDYDRWLGQSPWRPYSPVSVNLWRNHWDTGAGVIADMGPHMYDLAQMGNQSETSAPVEYQGKAVFPKDGFSNVPFEWDVEARYENGVRLLSKMGTKSIRFIGEEGWIEMIDETGEMNSEPKSLRIRSAPVQQHYNILSPHIRNFLECMKTRGLPVCHPEIAHRAHTIAHVTNICLRLGRPVRWDYKTERFIDDEDANRMLSRTMRVPWEI